jgi:outer membrane lipoprotein
MSMRREIQLLLAVWALAGCASSQVPQAIRERPLQLLTVTEVQQDPGRFLGRRVRWGGTIIAAHNRERTTEIEVLSRPLGTDGEPRGDKPGEGRFMALFQGFADPAEYPRDRLLTITGRVQRLEIHPVGEYPYRYPVVEVESRYLWPEPLPPLLPDYYPNPWYPPWYLWYRPRYY